MESPNLPQEVKFDIADWLNKIDVFVAMFVCKEWCDILRSFRGKKYVGTRAMIAAVKCNSTFKIFEWLISQSALNIPGAYDLLTDLLAEHGNIDVLAKLYSQNLICLESSTCAAAARGGQLKTLQWLHKLKTPCNASTFGAAAQRGRLEIMKWLYANKAPISLDVSGKIAASGNLEALKWWCVDICKEISNECIQTAIVAGHLHIVRWVHENSSARINPFPYLSMNLTQAILYGHVHIVEYLATFQTPGSTLTTEWELEEAITSGHLDIVKWIMVKYPDYFDKIPIKNVYEGITENDHQDIFDWFVESSLIKPDYDLVCLAVQHGRTYILEWAKTQDYNFTIKSKKLMYQAIKHEQRETMQWLHNKVAIPWPTDMCIRAGLYDSWTLVPELLESGHPYDNLLVIQATHRHRLDILQWIYEKKPIWWTRTFTKVLRDVIMQGINMYNQDLSVEQVRIWLQSI
jgi:hypothetical protein